MQSFLNQLVYFGFLQSLFLLLVYLLSSKNRQNINGYVAFLIIILMIGLSGRVLYISEIFGRDFRLIAFSEFSVMLFGATVFLFTRSALLKTRFSFSDLWHYVPGVVYNLLILFLFILPSDEVISMKAQSGELLQTILLLMGVGLVFNITYWAMSVRIFLRFKSDLQEELSYVVRSEFFRNFLIAIGLCLCYWSTMYGISFFNYNFIDNTSRQIIWLSITLVILFIAFYGIKEPQLFRVAVLIETKKYAQSKLTKEDLTSLKVRLDQLMEEKKPYLNSKLLKKELAEMLGISNPEIARLLNENIGMNFFEYVNYYRIREFVELAKSDGAHNLTFFGLAQDAGFNSKTTFNKSFKKLMGTSPKEYLTTEVG